MFHRFAPSLLALATVLSLALAAEATLQSEPTFAGSGAFRCQGADFYWPVNGRLGWIYREPDAISTSGSVHTGLDVWASGGDGSPVYALADGYVSRMNNSWSFDIIYNDPNVESYMTHTRHSLRVGQEVRGGQQIAVTDGDWVHVSIGAFHGYDDRVIEQTQDPSPFFGANVNYDAGVRNPLPYTAQLSSWCTAGGGAPPPPGGDALCDDLKDSLDALLILQYTANLVSGKPCAERADVNLDGVIDARDAALMLQYAAGLIT